MRHTRRQGTGRPGPHLLASRGAATARRAERVLVPAIATIAPGGVLEIRIGRRLDSPNRDRGAHWMVRHRKTLAWETWVARAIGLLAHDWSLLETYRVVKGEKGLHHRPVRREERRRVEIVRRVPSRRNFIKDEDNLRFSVKPVHDALVRLHLLTDDSMAWLEAPTPTQEVHPDGREETVIRVFRPARAAAA